MNRILSILSVSVLLLAVLVLLGCPSKELTSAKVYIQQDDWEKAEEQLKLAIEVNPADAEAHFLLGEAYARKGDYANMDKAFKASLGASPKFSNEIKGSRDKYWVRSFNIGVTYVKAGKLAKALESFQKCPIIDSNRVEAYKNIAYVYRRMDSTDAAISNYQKVIEIDPKDVKIMLQLGVIFYEGKQYDKCIELMDKILTIEPNNLDAISQKAFAFDSKGQSDKAFDAYNEALKRKPGDPDLLFNLGRLYFMRKDYKNSIEQFKKVLQASPDDFEANVNIGNAYLSIAEEYYKPLREGKELSEAEIKEVKNKGSENYNNAIPYLKKAVELKSDDPALWTNLGIAYINAGMKKEGEEAFKKADELK